MFLLDGSSSGSGEVSDDENQHSMAEMKNNMEMSKSQVISGINFGKTKDIRFEWDNIVKELIINSHEPEALWVTYRK